MSVQEAAWFLLQQPMSSASRIVIYTTGPRSSKNKNRKKKQQMNDEQIGDDSTDVLTLNIIERYEDRPKELNDIYLAEFVANYNITTFKKRMRPAVIRYNNYKIFDLDNYKREKALLFLEFKNELVDILDNKKYIQLYNENQDLIIDRRKLYAMCVLNENENSRDEDDS